MAASGVAPMSIVPTGIEPTGVPAIPPAIEPTGIEPTGIEPTGAPAMLMPATVFVPTLTPLQLPPASASASHHVVPPGSGIWLSVLSPSRSAARLMPPKSERSSGGRSGFDGWSSCWKRARAVGFA